MLRRFAILVAAATLGVSTLGLTACNTVSGAGKDLSAVGHDVSRGSNAAGAKINQKTGASPN
jgi:entericidin A